MVENFTVVDNRRSTRGIRERLRTSLAIDHCESRVRETNATLHQNAASVGSAMRERLRHTRALLSRWWRRVEARNNAGETAHFKPPLRRVHVESLCHLKYAESPDGTR